MFHCAKEQRGDKIVTTQTWWLAPSVPPRSSFRLVSRKLVSASQAIANVFGPSAIKIARPYPGPHPLNHPTLDPLFALYADDPAAAAAVLQDPAVVGALGSFASVVLDVGPDGILFADPADANLWAAYDAAGLSRLALNPAPMIDVAVNVHLAVLALLGATARSVARR